MLNLYVSNNAPSNEYHSHVFAKSLETIPRWWLYNLCTYISYISVILAVYKTNPIINRKQRDGERERDRQIDRERERERERKRHRDRLGEKERVREQIRIRILFPSGQLHGETSKLKLRKNSIKNILCSEPKVTCSLFYFF